MGGRSDFGVGRSPSLLREARLERPPLRLLNDIVPRKRRAADGSLGGMSGAPSRLPESCAPNVLMGTEGFKALIPSEEVRR